MWPAWYGLVIRANPLYIVVAIPGARILSASVSRLFRPFQEVSFMSLSKPGWLHRLVCGEFYSDDSRPPLTPKQLSVEILSGLTVSLALVPEAVAFAFVAGVAPLVGLYAAFIVGLVSFNIGVEIGQLLIVLPVFVALKAMKLSAPTFRRGFQLPVSAAISAIGLFWVAERTGLVGML